MAYRFKIGEEFGEGLRRIGAEQFERVRTGLARTPGAGAVHDVRKSIKRLRALLRLARLGIGEAAFKGENVRLRDVARLLSGARDHAVLQATIERLSHQPGAVDEAAYGRLQTLLDADRSTRAAISPASLAKARRTLAKAEQAWSKLRLEPDSFSPLGAGLAAVHQRGKEALVCAYDEDGTQTARDSAFHNWRKAVQQHWRHIRLFEHCWPQYAAVRVEQAKEISDLLGRAQDLAVYVAFVESLAISHDGERPNGARPAGPALTPELIQSLIEQARMQQEMLQSAARPRGERLFAEGSSGHVRRIELYWSLAAHIEPMPDGLSVPAPAPSARKPVEPHAVALKARSSRKQSARKTAG